MSERCPDILVIGYGNEIRSDDGAGRLLAEMVEGWKLPNVRSISARQLTPEMAEDMSQARLTIFADAYEAVNQRDSLDYCSDIDQEPVEGFKTRIVHVRPAREQSPLGHASSPGGLLVYAQAVYGRCPHCVLVALPGACFELGETLTKATEEATARAANAIKAFCERRLRQSRQRELHRA